jgi:hypothetical protein
VVGRGILSLSSRQQSSENGIESQSHRSINISRRYLGDASVSKSQKESVSGLIYSDIYNNIKIIPLEMVVRAPAPSIPAHPVE